MGIEGSVGVIEGNLILNKNEIGKRIKESFNGNIDPNELKNNIKNTISLINFTIKSINYEMDSILDRGITDFTGNINVSNDGEDEKNILTFISNKLNKAINNYLNNISIYDTELNTNLGDIVNSLGEAGREQGYYNQFIALLKEKNSSNNGLQNLINYASYTGGENPNS